MQIFNALCELTIDLNTICEYNPCQNNYGENKMEENKKKKLEGIGVNIPEVMSRLMDNEDFFLRLLKKFIADKSFSNLEDALKENRFEDAFNASHTLKGVAANLGLGAISDTVVPLTELLRNPPYDRPAIEAMFPKLKEDYSRVIKVIETL